MKITEIITESKLVKYDDQLSRGNLFWDKSSGEEANVWENNSANYVDYEAGDCPIYAIALHKLTGFPLMGLVEYSEEIDDFVLIHSYVKTQDGQILDSSGLTNIDTILSKYPVEGFEDPEEVNFTEKQLLKIGYGKNKCPPIKDAIKHATQLLQNLSIIEGNNSIDEMALAKYQTFGDFNKPGSFTGVDKKLVPHPKNIQKATKFFEQTPYDFRLFFANISGLGKYRETGPVRHRTLQQMFNKEQADEIINGSEDTITVIYVNNVGDRKVMMTPWIMAHRFGHAIRAGSSQDSTWSAWSNVEKHFFSQINQILVNDYGKQIGAATRRINTDDAFRSALSTEYNALFNAIGTQRSSRERQINRPYEFMYEMFAQYLKTGTVTLNPLPNSIPYGKMVFGRPSQYLTLKPEVRNDPDTKYITDTLGNDMAILFGDVLSAAVGNIYVM